METHMESISNNKNIGIAGQDKKCQRLGELYQILVCILATFSIVSPSMGFGYSAVALPVLQGKSEYGLEIDDQQATWIASALAIGTPFGCLLTSFVLRRGRKLSLLTTSAVSLLGWLIIHFSQSYEHIVFGRVVSGIAMGLASVPSIVYSAEVTSIRLRSTTLIWPSTAIAVGVLIVYIFGYFFPHNWRVVALLCSCFAVTSFCLTMYLLPESPLWLKDHGRLEQAVKTMKKLNGIPENDPLPAHLESMLRPNTVFQKQERSLKKELFARKSIEPFAIMLSFFFFQQFSGIFSIVYYAVDVTKHAGLTIDGYLGAVMIGLTRMVGSIIITIFSNSFGRRFPSIFSGIGMTVFLSILSFYLYLKNLGYNMNDGGLIPAVCVILYILASTLGFLIMPFAMVGEVYPSTVNDILSGLTTTFAYIFSFIAVKIYRDMVHILGEHGVFLFYAVMSLLGTIFVIGFLPETKGKSLAEIEEYFSHKKDRNSPKHAMREANVQDKDVMIPLKDVNGGA